MTESRLKYLSETPNGQVGTGQTPYLSLLPPLYKGGSRQTGWGTARQTDQHNQGRNTMNNEHERSKAADRRLVEHVEASMAEWEREYHGQAEREADALLEPIFGFPTAATPPRT